MSTKEITIEDLAGMSVAKQIHLAQDILARVATIVEPPTSILTAEQRREIDRRRKELRENPAPTMSVKEIISEITTA